MQWPLRHLSAAYTLLVLIGGFYLWPKGHFSGFHVIMLKAKTGLVTTTSESMSNAIMISGPACTSGEGVGSLGFSALLATLHPLLPDAALLLTLTGFDKGWWVTPLGNEWWGGMLESLRHGVLSVLLIDGRSASLPIKIVQLIYFNFLGDVAREKFYKSHFFYVSLEVCPSLWVCWLLNKEDKHLWNSYYLLVARSKEFCRIEPYSDAKR